MKNPYKSRKKYHMGSVLFLENLPANPNLLFEEWIHQASQNNIEANAMTLSTSNPKTQQPSSRMVLLKQHHLNSFIFFTHYRSHKGLDISLNPLASLLFWWPENNRQVRIEGIIRKTPEEQSSTYFSSRPFPAQISAHISPQSQKVSSYQSLLDKYDQFSKQKKDNKSLSCPADWGGYMLSAHYFEFWQGGENRMHQRICYESRELERCKENNENEKTTDECWRIYEIAP